MTAHLCVASNTVPRGYPGPRAAQEPRTGAEPPYPLAAHAPHGNVPPFPYPSRSAPASAVGVVCGFGRMERA